jgi:hypothetical protein
MPARTIALLFLALPLCAQSDSTLARVLQAPSPDHAIAARQLTDALLSLTIEDRRPARATVEKFAEEFTSAVSGKKLTAIQFTDIQLALVNMVRGEISNYRSARVLRDALASLRLDPAKEQAITTRFLAIGEEVRGPDDSPVKDLVRK